tara:strand:+ start:317 stop:526 length:210 start_codon:yes stop_codon:yes gene_type:complete
MINNEATQALVAAHTAIHAALNELNEYTEQVGKGNITAQSVKTKIIASVKANALRASVDIDAWTGEVAS